MSIPVMERVMGLEPTISAWKANVLPLHYTRILGLRLGKRGSFFAHRVSKSAHTAAFSLCDEKAGR